jgi:two-component system sensor histidine kinase BaeS
VARSLRGRLALALALTAALSLIASAVITFGLVRRYTADQVTGELAGTARAVAARGGDQLVLNPERFRAFRQALEVSGHLLATVGPAGNIVAETSEARAVAEAIDLRPALAGRTGSGFVQVGSTRYAYVVIPRRATRRGVLAGVIVAKPAGVTWSPILARVLLGAGIAALLGAAAATLLARRLARPVQDVAAATTKVASGDLQARVPVEGTEELAELARSFNRMATTLEEARRREGEFLASVSHELRTPITAIRGYVEALDEGAVRDPKGRTEALRVIKTETARLERLVADVMDLARAGSQGFRLELRDADVGDVLREAASAHAAEAAEAGVTIEVSADGSLACTTDAGRARQIVTNLVENAVRVSPLGGIVRIAGRSSPDWVVIDVTDHGPGIAPEHLPHVFERTYLRNVTAANGDATDAPEPGRLSAGSGLGLAIVRELVRALGGQVRVASEPGKGTTFSVALPRR